MVHGHNLHHIMHLCHFENAAPRRPGPHLKGHFDQVDMSNIKEKKVVKQVYCVRRDNHKDKSLDMSSGDENPNVTTITLGNVDNDVKQLKHPLDLSNSQLRKLQRLSAEKLKEKNMAWVPKWSEQVHDKGDIIILNGAKGMKEKDGV
jgi:hypothetical protein